MRKFDIEFCKHLEERYGYAPKDARIFVKDMDKLEAIELATLDFNLDIGITAQPANTFLLEV